MRRNKFLIRDVTGMVIKLAHLVKYLLDSVARYLTDARTTTAHVRDVIVSWPRFSCALNSEGGYTA